MKLQDINIENLKLSPLNVRKHGEKSGDDLVASIKANGIIQPLLVRPTRGEEDVSPTGTHNHEGFEVIAGQRRFNACQIIAKEKQIDPIPCAIMEDGDDAKAIEASLTENIERLPMDDIDQFEAFSALIKQGRTVEEIAVHFGVTERLVTQRLAIANLYTPILNAYRREEIDLASLRLLTMASRAQQKTWFKLHKSDGEYAPTGYQLKNWLFGGEQIPTSSALFELETYKGTIIADLFGEESYFSHPALFWEQQSIAIAKIIEDYREDGWEGVVLLDVGEHFPSYDYVETPRENGGKVFIAVARDGSVTIYEGLLSRKDIKKLDGAQGKEDGDTQTIERPELTKPMQNYLDLHRHAAVRCQLMNHSDIALRLCTAHIIAGSDLWTIYAEPQKASNEAIKDSLQFNKAEEKFVKQRAEVMAFLDLKKCPEGTLVHKKSDWGKSHDLLTVFVKLLELNDEDITTILTFIVAETLQAGTDITELLGKLLCVNMADHWAPDDTFLDLLRDKEAINAILADIGGKAVAEGNLTATAKVQKNIIKTFLDGTRTGGKPDWQPNYMRFPMQGYTKQQDTIKAVKMNKTIKEYLKVV